MALILCSIPKTTKIFLVNISFILLLFSLLSLPIFNAYAQRGGNATGGSAFGGQTIGPGAATCYGCIYYFYSGPVTGGSATGGTATINDEKTIASSSSTSSSSLDRSVTLSQISYHKNDPQNPYSSRIWINASKEVLSEIGMVTYYLHPTFNPNVINATTKENNFGISFTNWGFFDLKAKVFFKDGFIVEIQLPKDQWKVFSPSSR
jgi:hypothetical protein